MVQHRDDMRQRADWMTPADDDILEIVREEGNMSPQAIEHFGGPKANHAGVRLRKLAEAGLLEQIVRGLYRFTEEADAYLDEEFDASTLPTPDDE